MTAHHHLREINLYDHPFRQEVTPLLERDVSAYAVGQAEREVRPYLKVCRAQDLGEHQRYDLVHICGVLIYLRLSEIVDLLQTCYRLTRVGAVFDEPVLERISRWYDERDISAMDPLRLQELPASTWECLYKEAGFLPSGGWYRRDGHAA